MPLTADETLKKLVEAIEEGKATTRDLHAARATAMDVLKKQRREIAEGITNEVNRAVQEIRTETRDLMVSRVEEIMGAIERDWRTKLGLDD